MKPNNSSKKEILNRIKTAREGRSSFRSVSTEEGAGIYNPILPNPVDCFKGELEAISGQCIVCEDRKDTYAKLKDFLSENSLPFLFCRDKELMSELQENDIPVSDDEKQFETMEAGVTTCEFLVARTGSVMVSSASPSGRQMHIFPPVHVVLASVNQLVEYPEEALVAIHEKYGENLPSAITTITGPSRTADIEKTLVLGAHGPKQIVVFLSKK